VLYRLAATAFAPTTQEIQAVGAEIGQRWLREILETLEAWRGTALGDGLYATEFADPDRAKERLAKEVGDSMAAILNDGPGPRARRFLALSKVNRT